MAGLSSGSLLHFAADPSLEQHLSGIAVFQPAAPLLQMRKLKADFGCQSIARPERSPQPASLKAKPETVGVETPGASGHGCYQASPLRQQAPARGRSGHATW